MRIVKGHSRYALLLCGRASALLALSLAAGLTLGCSTVLGIGDLPEKTDGGSGASSGGSSGSSSGASSGGGGSSGSSSGGSSEAGSGSGGSSEAGNSSGAATDSGSDDAAAFDGIWQITGGMQTLSGCTNPGADGTEVDPSTLEVIFTPGTTSDLIGRFAGQGSSGCTFLANVSGTIATAPPGQTCTEFVDGDSVVLTLSSYTFTRSGNTGQESATGVFVDQTSPGMCNLSTSATYTKI